MEKLKTSEIKYKDLSFLWPYFKKYKILAIKGGLGLVITTLLIMPSPLLTKYLIDEIFPSGDLSKLTLVGLIVLLVLALKSVTKYFQSLYFLKFNERVVFDLRLLLLNKIQRQPFLFFKEYETGYLMSRVLDDVNNLRGALAGTFVSSIRDVGTFIVGFTLMIILSWKLTLVSIILLPFIALSAFVFNNLIRNFSNQFSESKANVSKKLEESINGVSLFKLFTAEKYDLLKFFRVLKANLNDYIKLNITSELSAIISGFFIGIGPLLVVWYGGYLTIKGQLTLGGLIAFNSFLGYLFGPLSRIISANNAVQHALVSINRIKKILELPEEVGLDNGIKLDSVNSIELCNVSFNYNNSQNVLKEISLKAERGQKIGVIGKSGIGKTTLMKLISKEINPRDGKILINDNHDLKKINTKGLRKRIGIVSQEPFLLHETIEHNISLGKKCYSRSEMTSATRLAQIHDFIMRLPQGYSTIIGGESGVQISTGQKQRIAIARAILKDPDILILDEPTSNIDTESERLITKAIKDISKGRITFIVAHRLSTLRIVDHIILIEDGRIREMEIPENNFEFIEQMQDTSFNLERVKVSSSAKPGVAGIESVAVAVKKTVTNHDS